MDNEKKNNSLIYQLYQKYKDTKEQSRKNQTEPTGTMEEFFELQRDVAAKEVSAPVEKPAAPEPEYLSPMFQLSTYLHQSGQAKQPPSDLSSLEQSISENLSCLAWYEDQRKEIQKFVSELAIICGIVLTQLTKEPEDVPDAWKEEAESAGPPAMDGNLHIKILDHSMYAICFAIPPSAGGKDLGEEAFTRALEEQKITCGADQELMGRILEEGLYWQLFLIAQGTPAIHGINGRIEEKISCLDHVDIREDERGNADFKNLNLLHLISQGQVICDIIPPTEGCPGVNLCGGILPFKAGKPATIPSGKNTLVSEDGLHLLAAVDGHVSYRNGKYQVEPLLEIKENVDYSVGNIDFPGDVLIHGDVRTGFTVKAGGSLTIQGMVESASLTADGDITIAKGMNGNLTGTIDAKGIVKASFLENCTVYAGGTVQADSVIACEIYCEDSVLIQGSKGVLIGGSITAYRTVEARMIGSKSRRETVISLGETPRLAARRKALQAELNEAVNVLEKLSLNISYLDRLRGSLPPDKLSILNQLQEQYSLYQERKPLLEDDLYRLTQENADFSQCAVKSNMIFPVTKIFIGSESTVIDNVLSKCNIFLDKGELVVGSL